MVLFTINQSGAQVIMTIHACLSLLRFSLIIPVVTRCSSFSFILTWQKKVSWCLGILFLSDVVSASGNTVFFIYLHFMRFIAFSVRTKFLLPPVPFVAVLKLSTPHMHTPGWVSYSTIGLFVCGGGVLICTYRFHCQETHFC